MGLVRRRDQIEELGRSVTMDGVKFGSEMMRNNEQRALRDIKNFAGAPPPYPCAPGKRELSDRSTVDDHSCKRFIGHRPITRRFSASLANHQSQPCHQGPSTRQLAPIGSERRKKFLPPATSSNEHTSILIDEDDHKSAEDSPLPMIEEIEEMVTCELKEVKMEDLEEEHLPDIDSCDANNPLAVAEYVEDIYNFFWQTEDLGCVCPDYMYSQFDINEKMRAILIDWLIEVHYKFELMDQTLFLTVNIIDRFLARQTVVRKKLQLVGVTAMFLACKYEEVTVPIVEDLILISDNAYTREEVLKMERLMVNALQFNMSVPTPYVFMRRFLKAAKSDKQLELMSFYLIELSLVEYQMLKFLPSLLAASAVYTAQCMLKGFKYWSKISEMHTRYTENQLVECSRRMVEFHQQAGCGKLTGVFRKYSTFRFGCASKSETILFLLDARK